MRAELNTLLRGAVETDAILKGYQAGELLRLGVRDLLHEAELEETMFEMSCLAEAFVAAVTSRVLDETADRSGPAPGSLAVFGQSSS